MPKKDSRAESSSSLFDTIMKVPLFLCHNVIFGSIHFKLTVYYCTIIIGSLLQSLNLTPNSYFASKKNIFNVYFVKIGWAWTIGLLVPLICLNLRKKLSTIEIVSQHLSRLLVASIFWFMWTKLFVTIELYTGECQDSNHSVTTYSACKKAGLQWTIGHDISGHVFLLMYSLLMINEEIRAYVCGGKTSTDALETEPQTFDRLVTMIHATLPFLLACLTIIWELMLLSTSLYFHTMLHKIEAALIATFSWYITYQIWYQPNSTHVFVPATPKTIEKSS